MLSSSYGFSSVRCSLYDPHLAALKSGHFPRCSAAGCRFIISEPQSSKRSGILACGTQRILPWTIGHEIHFPYDAPGTGAAMRISTNDHASFPVHIWSASAMELTRPRVLRTRDCFRQTLCCSQPLRGRNMQRTPSSFSARLRDGALWPLRPPVLRTPFGQAPRRK